MLTKFDEWTCHQTVETFDHPLTSDRAWTEKIWMNFHDRAGKVVLATGFGVYPNRNVMDGYVCVNLDNARQHNLRLSRELRPRIDDLSVGPLSYDVQDAYRSIRLTIAENDRPVRGELEFVGRFQPVEEEHQFMRRHGRVLVDTARYSQLGRARGWLEVAGERIELDESTTYAQRDHSWGIRMGVGDPETGVQETDIAIFRGMLILWTTFQFSDWGLALYYIEGADGSVQRLTGHVTHALDESASLIPVVGLEHDFQYHPRSARMSSGRMVIHLADGSTRTLEMSEMTTMYLRGGGYVGYKDFFHGKWMGPDWQDGESWDLTEAGKRDEVHGLDDTVCEVSCNGEKGYGIIENMILPPFPRYGFGMPVRQQ